MITYLTTMFLDHFTENVMKKWSTVYTTKAITCPACGDGFFIFHANQQDPVKIISVCTSCGCSWYRPENISLKSNSPDLRLEGESDYAVWKLATKEQIEAAGLGSFISRSAELFV